MADVLLTIAAPSAVKLLDQIDKTDQETSPTFTLEGRAAIGDMHPIVCTLQRDVCDTDFKLYLYPDGHWVLAHNYTV